MKFLATVAACAALAVAAPAQEKGTLGVQLALVDKTNIKLVVTNEGKEEIQLLKTGTIIDAENPVQRVQASSLAGQLQFEGISLHVAAPFLNNGSFSTVKPGESIENTFDVAQIYDLTSGGDFSFLAKGVLSIADASGHLAGAIPYQSNLLEAKIDATAAAASRSKVDKRINLLNDCTGDRRNRIAGALTDAYGEAYYARQEALYGPAARMNEYFKRSDSAARQIVADVYSRVMDECDYGGQNNLYCTTTGDRKPCDQGVLAYTVLPEGPVVMCDAVYTLSNKNRQCHGYALADTLIHEFTHLGHVKGTADNAYGYDALTKLGSDQALDNADTYDFFSQSIWGDCPGQNKRWQVYTCTDSNFSGRCFGVQGFLHSCSNVPSDLNDQISSVGSSFLADCSGFKDADCQGQRIDFGNGQQLNSLPGDLNDQLTSFYC